MAPAGGAHRRLFFSCFFVFYDQAEFVFFFFFRRHPVSSVSTAAPASPAHVPLRTVTNLIAIALPNRFAPRQPDLSRSDSVLGRTFI